MTEHNFPIDSAGISDRGLNEKRPQNEDAFLEVNEAGLFVVADGVGGAQAGDVASQMAVEVLDEAFKGFDSNRDAEELMKIAIEKANSAIFRMSRDLPQLSTMATTIVALHISGNIATIGHVGDSRLYRLDGRGRLFPETLDHSVVAEEVRAGRMTVAQAANHPSKNIISRALGAEPTVEVDLKTIMFEPKTTFLLCSDGITRHIEDFEIRDLLISNKDAQTICEKMREMCYERGAEDNLTAIVAKVKTHSQATAANVGNNHQSVDSEEVTIQTPRHANVETLAPDEATDYDNEISTQKLKMPEPEVVEFDQEQSEKPYEIEIESLDEDFDYSDITEEEQTDSDQVEVSEEVDLTDEDFVDTQEFPDEDEIEEEINELQKPIFTDLPEDKEITEAREGTSVIGSIVSSIGIFLIGAILGAGLYYVFSQQTVPPIQPAPPQQQSAQQPDDDFQAAKRAADGMPEEYIAENSSNPEKAEDFYLLGRAYFFAGNFLEAKRSFEQARERIEEVDEEDRSIIENEIAVFLTNIDIGFAQTEIKKYIDRKYGEEESPANENQ